ncbi:uncharacterized protein NECHADRAFT_56119 [Fusarium vanettenii 77-13-4]|uniref:Zn(2)-C6 fungal-type domain-containing protein n=1 Tax=Fusarium vanettenii (strain ATCC MYA-4622 / CBS 123669 / FGSC 9596 / NRRL 45880 / 77-13-4) TaxID=660122 RepID=C7ZQF2_FUSV7|nr:uncharacterized protein NECHADRAFT_56119 [Fusarium vanettenii 77-13-4]EEU33758.1 hypothetical protein NECHADRAFT_56119 [Fusarium vanettenii 77-13-4]
MSSLPLSERKACLGCARAKRTCDKQMPNCQRCAERNLDCRYPTTRRYCRAPPPASVRQDRVSTANALIPYAGHVQSQASRRRADSDNTATGHGISDPPTAHSPTAATVTHRLWFLELETWAIRNTGTSTCRFNPGPIRVSLGHKSWTSSLEDWLRQWVEEGCNPFIHKQLYLDTGLPQCLQEAWTTLTAYFAKTTLNEHIVMKIIEDRADRLLQTQIYHDDSLMAVPGLGTIEHLARVQALFIYEYLRLYDGSIRQRALAESSIQTLLTWCAQLWQSATLDADREMQLFRSPEPNRLDATGELATFPHWRAWVLSESVRRTWLVCHSTLAAYFRERDGWNECTGEIKFTASQGLWDATSSGSWAELACGREPLFVRSLHVDELLTTAVPTEVDSFSTAFMSLLMGREKLDSWAASPPCIDGTAMSLGADFPSA